MPATHLVLIGPTASGKSRLALDLARRHDGEIELVSADSMQVYRGMDIGTAKPSASERAEIAHHVIDVVDPTDDFSVARFQDCVRDALVEIEGRGHRAILVGGTGLYVRAIVDNLTIPGQWPAAREQLEAVGDTAALHRRLAEVDPEAATKMEPSNRRRIVRALEVTIGSGRPFSSYGPGLDEYPPSTRFRQVGLTIPRGLLALRISERFQWMLADGLVDEVRALVDTYGGRLSRTARQALGYREILQHLEQGTGLDAAVAEAVQRTRTFSVRQERWFRRDPRITWYDALENPVALSERVLGDWQTA